MDGIGTDNNINVPSRPVLLQKQIARTYQKILDDSTPHTQYRWIFTLGLLILYIIRIYIVGGFYIISYALGIYLLNLLIGFLAPQFDPEEDETDEGLELPTDSNDEFKPFIRKLPEFKFWHLTARSFVIAIFCTFLPFLDIPVYYPILLIYFIALFVVTMKKQIKHMIKHKYVPFDLGKKTYKPSE